MNLGVIALSAAIAFLLIHAELIQRYQHEKLDVATYSRRVLKIKEGL